MEIHIKKMCIRPCITACWSLQNCDRVRESFRVYRRNGTGWDGCPDQPTQHDLLIKEDESLRLLISITKYLWVFFLNAFVSSCISTPLGYRLAETLKSTLIRILVLKLAVQVFLEIRDSLTAAFGWRYTSQCLRLCLLTSAHRQPHQSSKVFQNIPYAGQIFISMNNLILDWSVNLA
jgi:hypothetical protein